RLLRSRSTSSIVHPTPPPSRYPFCQITAAQRSTPSFPTRRSSDLTRRRRVRCVFRNQFAADTINLPSLCAAYGIGGELIAEYARSEEHTSELQSRFDLVCRLLLEKKNMQKLDHLASDDLIDQLQRL